MSILEYREKQYLHFISRLLVGRASACLELIGGANVSSWAELKEEMIKEFTSANVKEQVRKKLIFAVKKPSETILEFLVRIKRLAKLVYGEENNVYVRDSVVRGLPIRLQDKIRHKQIVDLEGIINMMERYETEQSLMSYSVNVVRGQNSVRRRRGKAYDTCNSKAKHWEYGAYINQPVFNSEQGQMRGSSRLLRGYQQNPRGTFRGRGYYDFNRFKHRRQVWGDGW